MRFSLASVGAIALCASLASAANDNPSHAEVAGQFVAALRHQHFRDAAALFAPKATNDIAAAEITLKRIDDNVGGFSTMQPTAKLPEGPTIRVEVPPREHVPFKIQKSIQFRYAGTARDGKPVYYVVDLTADGKPAQVLSLGIHFLAADAPSKERAERFIRVISR